MSSTRRADERGARLVLDHVGERAGRAGEGHVDDGDTVGLLDAVHQAEVDDVDAELRVDHVAHGLLEVLDRRPASPAAAGGSGMPAAPRTTDASSLMTSFAHRLLLRSDQRVLERHPAQQSALHPRRVPGDAGERDPVAEHVLVRLDLAAALRHLLERVQHREAVLDGLADDEVGEHRRRRLADRAAERLVGDVGDGAALQPHPQRDLVAAGRVDLVRLGVERLAQPRAVRGAVVIQDDLLVQLFELHLSITPKNSRAARTASTSASTSSGVVYTWNDARTVAAMPNRRCSGHAQWCPTRTATPRSSSTCPTSWAWIAVDDERHRPAAVDQVARPDDAHARHLGQPRERAVDQLQLVLVDRVHPDRR